MKIVEAFPRAVREIENLFIPMPDGCRLAARVWIPEDAASSPVPAIIEYIPYRKRDRTRRRDEPMHRYFAGHGYAAVRIDVRGSGDSDGVLLDEYTEQELDDAVEAIRWVAAQAWCSGTVGMMGKSWGGFNSLQVAARRPPELGSIITVCAADDRYADDAHYMGGCLLNENLIWGSVLLTLNAQAPDRDLVGDRWRGMWLERLESTPLFPEIWLRHQRRDAYWKRGSVCEDFARIACPVYAVGGWADGYSNAVPRLLAGLTGPRKGLVGPWAHVYPHEGVPGPAIGFLQEALRWWDHWLKGIDTGIMDEPMYRAWMQESVPPRSYDDERPGRWVAEAAWPSDRLRPRRFAVNARGLADVADPEERMEFRSPQTVGLAAGSWCGFGFEGEMPGDQREDDGKSLAFDSEPLVARLEILGAPEATLALAVDRPRAFVTVRLNDVAPDGSSARVTYALLNLTHRASHETPARVKPGRRIEVRVRLNDVAHAFPAGHRLRLAVSTAYWPMAWPSPEPVTLTLFAGSSSLDLPVRPPRGEDAALPPFGRPEGAPPGARDDEGEDLIRRTVERDLTTRETVYAVDMGADASGEVALTRVEPFDVEIGQAVAQRFRIRDDDPLSAQAEIRQRIVRRRDGYSTRIETSTRLTATARTFRLAALLEAFEGEARVFHRRWRRSVRRDLV